MGKPVAAKLAISQSCHATMLALNVGALAKSAANVGAQHWRVGEISRQRWRLARWRDQSPMLAIRKPRRCHRGVRGSAPAARIGGSLFLRTFSIRSIFPELAGNKPFFHLHRSEGFTLALRANAASEQVQDLL